MNIHSLKEQPTELRRRAEELVGPEKEELRNLSPEKVIEIVHELRVHQAELEMQNEELRRAGEELEKAHSRITELYDFAPAGYFSLDREGIIREANLTGAGMLGMDRTRLQGRPFSLYFASGSRMALIRYLTEVWEKKNEHIIDLEFKRADGDTFWGGLKSNSIHDARGRVTGIRIVVTDITERKRAEDAFREYAERLRQKTAQVEAANKELESFSYSISHDLRAPLRSLDGFSLALEEDYGNKLDDQAKDYIQRIRASAQRMAQLIDDLLQLSRTTRAEFHYTTVDLSDQARSILDELRRAEPDRKVESIVPEGIKAEGDEALLRVVLQNLLRNAWKFTSHTHDARIEFGEKREDGRRIFFVRDNGAGFDMHYVHNLFIPFRRLHTEKEFPGTGIGLSLVKRIIDRHGGKIWAEGEIGKGATFYFTLGE